MSLMLILAMRFEPDDFGRQFELFELLFEPVDKGCLVIAQGDYTGPDALDNAVSIIRVPHHDAVDQINMSEDFAALFFIMQRQTAFYFSDRNVAGENDCEMVAIAPSLFEKRDVSGMKDVKGPENHDTFHILALSWPASRVRQDPVPVSGWETRLPL
ncbi:MAG: hypothetical protein UY92_C0006G0076 [Candidatus Magasanikbacteria bacterium GW2011_GWA2_56_11]|uniref:Uncharacterized protein n=1 Tax=Candidatus Magasanikbacteria bacterium GW2011_GWA2_56_11 TaxID=1619044 RepID=A0A0G1YH18_9BACT|nr:MAG: hypothetical protein UY92_C0006G0076 [Candidatus Magasanikbacteria bacterium GW2011_GWA2_56_11]